MKRPLSHLLLGRLAASSLLLFDHMGHFPSGVSSVSLEHVHFGIDNGTMAMIRSSPAFEVHHYAPGAFSSQPDGVREGSLVIVKPRESYGICRLISYLRYLFAVGNMAFGFVARIVRDLAPEARVYLAASPGTRAMKFCCEKVPLVYPDLTGLDDAAASYRLVDAALEDPSLDWIGLILRNDPDLIGAWTSTSESSLKLMGIVVCRAIADKTCKERALEALDRLAEHSPSAKHVMSSVEDEVKIQKHIRHLLSCPYPLLSMIVLLRRSGEHSYLKALSMEVLYCMSRTCPVNVEIACDVLRLAYSIQSPTPDPTCKRDGCPTCRALKDGPVKFCVNARFRDAVCFIFASLKLSDLNGDMEKTLLDVSPKACKKQQLDELKQGLYLAAVKEFGHESLGGCEELWAGQEARQLLQAVRRLVLEHRKQIRPSHGCPCFERNVSAAPHLPDLFLDALVHSRSARRLLLPCSTCKDWRMTKDVLFRCMEKALLHPTGLRCHVRRFLAHLSDSREDVSRISMEVCRSGFQRRPHGKRTLDDAVIEFVYRNGPPLLRQGLAYWVRRMNLSSRNAPESSNQGLLIGLAEGVPDGHGFDGFMADFGWDRLKSEEIGSKWRPENSDFSLLRCSLFDQVYVLEDGVVMLLGSVSKNPVMMSSLDKCAGPRTTAQVMGILGSDHTCISFQVCRQSSQIQVTRVAKGDADWVSWRRSLMVRWSPTRGTSVFQFGPDPVSTARFPIDEPESESEPESEPELFCIFDCGYYPYLDTALSPSRQQDGGAERIMNADSSSDVVPRIREIHDLNLLTSVSGVEVVLTESNRSHRVVEVLGKPCLDGVLETIYDVKSWAHMKHIVGELRSSRLICAFLFPAGI